MKRRRHNPIGAKIAWAVGLTALAATAIGTGIYFARKKSVAILPDNSDPTDDVVTPPPKDEPPKDIVLQAAKNIMAQGEPYQPGLHHGLDSEGNY